MCAKATEPYRQSIPDIHLSLEYCTDSVPQDGNYYVLRNDQVEGRYRTLKEAQVRYRQLVAESGYAGPEKAANAARQAPEEIEQFLDRLHDYWADSHKHTRRGGKTMYRS